MLPVFSHMWVCLFFSLSLSPFLSFSLSHHVSPLTQSESNMCHSHSLRHALHLCMRPCSPLSLSIRLTACNWNGQTHENVTNGWRNFVLHHHHHLQLTLALLSAGTWLTSHNQTTKAHNKRRVTLKTFILHHCNYNGPQTLYYLIIWIGCCTKMSHHMLKVTSVLHAAQ